MKNRLQQIINLKRNNFEIKLPEAKGDKPVDVQEAEQIKKLGEPTDLATYDWNQCIEDQVARYGDEETAARICGWIKANYQTSFAEGESDGLESACWPGYIAIGTKDLDGRTVPNCVPEDKVEAKQEFVIPAPESGEDEQSYISRCMKAIGSEYDTQEQALAVCYSQLEK